MFPVIIPNIKITGSLIEFVGYQGTLAMLNKLSIDVIWTGPYSWPKFESENQLPSIPKHSGVYLWTIEYQNGYLIYAAGITRRSIPSRFREHTQKYMSGDYTVLDIAAMEQGIRKEIWHGWGWTPEKRNDFNNRKLMILDAAHKQLSGFRIFVANVDQPRISERIEAAIMNCLYQQPAPLCDIPDKGMFLAPRRQNEQPFIVKNITDVHLHGLPQSFEA